MQILGLLQMDRTLRCVHSVPNENVNANWLLFKLFS